MPQVQTSTRPTHCSPQTSRQARNQYRRYGPRISSQEQRRLARGGELLARAERIRAAEQRRKQGETKRKEKEVQQREERRRGCREWVKDVMTGSVGLAIMKKGDESVQEETSGPGPWRVQSSQMSLGRFLKVVQHEARQTLQKQQSEDERDPWDEDVDVDGLIEATMGAVQASTIPPALAEPLAKPVLPLQSPATAISKVLEQPTEKQDLTSSDSFWNSFILSSAAVEREIQSSAEDDCQQRTNNAMLSTVEVAQRSAAPDQLIEAVPDESPLPASSSELTGLLSAQDVALLADELESRVDDNFTRQSPLTTPEECFVQPAKGSHAQLMPPPTAKHTLPSKILAESSVGPLAAVIQDDDFILSTQDWREME